MSRSKKNRVGGALHPRGNYAKTRAVTLDDMYLHLLMELALNRFSWRGLPPTVDERWLEICLCEYGCALFFEDKRIGRFLVTQAGYQGKLNVYNNPTRFEPVGVNYHYRQLKAGSECIPIWDNRMRVGFKPTLWQYARRLADIDKAYDVNLESLKLPTIITADPRTKLTVQNMLQQRQDGQDYIIGYDSLDPGSSFQPWPNTTPYLLDKFVQQKTQVTNEVLGYLGIQSSGTEKKERLISDEVAQANEKVDVFRLSFLKARQAAATEINRLWPQLNVWVEYADAQSSGVPNALDASASGTTDIDMPASYDAGIGGVL
jgi:hypothetical protein